MRLGAIISRAGNTPALSPDLSIHIIMAAEPYLRPEEERFDLLDELLDDFLEELLEEDLLLLLEEPELLLLLVLLVLDDLLEEDRDLVEEDLLLLLLDLLLVVLFLAEEERDFLEDDLVELLLAGLVLLVRLGLTERLLLSGDLSGELLFLLRFLIVLEVLELLPLVRGLSLFTRLAFPVYTVLVLGVYFLRLLLLISLVFLTVLLERALEMREFSSLLAVRVATLVRARRLRLMDSLVLTFLRVAR